ncbi:MAG: hypothetical protein LBB23_02765 [Rickettsiales bacterium]|nr:hypothetical protein [Rickettsiales bacterium]
MSNQNTIIFLTGLSGSGKGYFFEQFMPLNAFYKLKQMTSRDQRKGEKNGVHYYFSSEQEIEKTKLATRLFVNEKIWKPGDRKWLYGVPESEMYSHQGQNLVYEIIEPRYARMMMDWMDEHDFNYHNMILHFESPAEHITAVQESRANMPNDLEIRRTNTSNIADFEAVNLQPTYNIVSSPERFVVPEDLVDWLNMLSIEAKVGTKCRLPKDMVWKAHHFVREKAR